ncbi:MAG: tripartite tricarboxylate transporter TctB family protein [Spirochaetaceae bacterium]|jgi:hypothetical protein|nr:tripartite tricarboxylate transporter TctB family protein [Spirochaetaceae bacterium]
MVKKQINFFGALGLLVFTASYLAAAFRIKDFSTTKWYESAGLFPKIIGTLLLFFCLVYLFKNLRGAVLSAEDKKNIVAYLKSAVFLRLLVAVGLFALYVFVLLRVHFGDFQLPYEAATFIYLFLNMVIFRTGKFAVWRIAVISAVVSVAVGFCFTYGAKIPLP